MAGGILRFVKGVIKDIALNWAIPRAYTRAADEPVIPKTALFISRTSAEMPDSFSLLYERLGTEQGYDVEFISLGYGRLPIVGYYRNCLASARRIAKMELVFLDDASDMVSCLPLRRETKVAQLWHACGAFKKFGMSTADLLFGGSREEKRKHPFYENLSLVTISSPEVQWAYAEAMDLEGKDDIIKPLGVSRTDVFYNERFLSDARKAVEERVPEIREKRVILYAPTFRGRVTEAKAPDGLDIAAMGDSLGSDFVLLIKHHPFVKSRPMVPSGYEKFAFDVSDDLDIEQLLPIADVCVSDYSSLVFEYSLFERPMAFFAFDIEEYEDWRGFYYPYDELTPGPVFRTTEELISYLSDLDRQFNLNQVEKFKLKFMSACDGHATDRIINQLVVRKASHV